MLCVLTDQLSFPPLITYMRVSNWFSIIYYYLHQAHQCADNTECPKIYNLQYTDNIFLKFTILLQSQKCSLQIYKVLARKKCGLQDIFNRINSLQIIFAVFFYKHFPENRFLIREAFTRKRRKWFGFLPKRWYPPP